MLKPRRYKRVVSAGTPAPSGDPYWTSVSLLTNFENNLTFQDGSTNNFAITRNGTVNPSLNTPFTGGVGGSEYFNGSSQLSAGSNAAFAFGTGAYTVECWVYLTSAVSASHQPCFVFNDTTNGFGFWNENGGNQLNIGVRAGSVVLASTTTLTANIWNHVVAVRSGTGTNLTSIFVNGTRVANGTDATNWTVTGPLKVGGITLANYYLNGFASNVRIVKGTAVYDPTLTTLTVPTAPLTAITNTSLLITGTGQGMFDNATFVDQGPNALTVTATGAPVYSGLSPFGNTYAGSVYISGSATYLSTPANTAFAFGTGDFTIEAWIYDSGTTAAFAQIVGASTYGLANEFLLSLNGSTRKLFAQLGLAGGSNSTGNVTASTWTHVAVVRSGTTLTFYINGTASGSSTNATLVASTIIVTIGTASNNNADSRFVGYISNLRIVKGTAVYTANFTPSTTPLTAITNTSLLVRGDTGAFYDMSNNGLAETGAGTTVVTTQAKKFGNESGSFPSSSYISLADNAKLQMGSGDFTIEFWINFSSLTSFQTLFDKGYVSAGGLLIQTNTGTGTLVVYAAGSAVITASSASTTGSWDFYALARSGTTLTLYRNGTSVGSATNSTNFNNTSVTYLGGSTGGGGYYLNGYLDDIRITKGVARYTATFTPPTATFPTA